MKIKKPDSGGTLVPGAGIYTALAALFLAISEPRRRAHKQGMTLIEILITISIVALLATLVFPAVAMSMQHRDNARTASHMRIAVSVFESYRAETGSYPADVTPGVVPVGMADYFADFGIDWWGDDTDVGGKWDWDQGYHYAFSISIAGPTASPKQLVKLDAMLDDGDLLTGTFRAVGAQHHYILEE